MKHYLLLLYPISLVILGCGRVECSCESSNEASPDSGKLPTTVLDTTPRVIGIGGIFFYDEQPDALMKWYGDHLGLAINPHGSPFEFRNTNKPEEINYLQWSVHGSTNYYKPSKKEFMINYRVFNIEGLVNNLELEGIQMLDSITEYEGFGKFVHFMDPSGNKIELWEANDSALSKTGTKTTK